MRPRVVLIDAGGTLFHLEKPVGHIYAETAERYGVVVTPEEVQARFSSVFNERSPTLNRAGVVATPDEERNWWREVVKDVFSSVDRFERFDEFFDELHALFAAPDLWRLYREVPVALGRMRAAGIRLAIVSNWDTRLTNLCRDLDVHGFFEHILASADTGASKPSREMFDLALSRMNVASEESVHIGDSWRDDVCGALGAGVVPVWLQRNDGYIADAGPKNVDERVTVVTSLDEAAKVVIS